jgi:hypothetical protein
MRSNNSKVSNNWVSNAAVDQMIEEVQNEFAGQDEEEQPDQQELEERQQEL